MIAKYIVSEKEKFGREVDEATAEAEVEQQSVDDLLTDMIRTVEVPRI